MIFVKFIVMFGCISILSALQTNYCQICSNHTLCQYKVPGPSALCKLYDTTALLSNQEIREIVHKINERRNFVAMGNSAKLPQASNMKKIHWSPELASFAQRWADQCDPFLHPDRKDDCRDLENTKVGQNIGSVVGTSPGPNIKSFIEMWFMQILNYSGSVAYYNQSHNHNTDYFTQLIWAETELVGCGKVKFYVDENQVMMERLVCNFALKGNIQGKPIYDIGYAGTHCPKNMIPDRKHKGLCDYEHSETLRKSTTQMPSVSSLLEIVNITKNIEEQEIDLIHNNLKASDNKKKKQKNIKTRHILSNNIHGTIRRTPLRDQNMRKSVMQNMSRNMRDNAYLYQHEQGHSHLYHGNEPARHEPSPGPIYSPKYYFQGNNNQDLRRYDYTTPPVYLISSPIYIQYNKCSRKRIQSQFCCYSHQCTRRQDQCCHQNTECHVETFTNPTVPETLCSQNRRCCSTCRRSCPPHLTTIDDCNHNCQCTHNKCTKVGFRSNNFPNMLRSGNHKITQKKNLIKQNTEQYNDFKLSKIHKITHEKKKADISNEEKKEENIHTKFKDHGYFHRIETELRKKRQSKDEITLKPFWKINERNYKSPKTKALRYTTLSNRNNLKKHRLISTEKITIKIGDYSNEENDEEDNDEELTTEKYLSFDELMYLRKLNHNYMDYNARRDSDKNKNSTKKKKEKEKDEKKKDKVKDHEKKKDKGKNHDKKKEKDHENGKKKEKHETTKAKEKKKHEDKVKDTNENKDKGKLSSQANLVTTTTIQATTQTTMQTTQAPTRGTTTEYTANTPFIRQKQCTRKLTCTWTAFTVTAGDGKQIGPGIDIGSRTPPGYVEGCTRTSTCTRDYLERNKLPSTLPEISGEGHEADETTGDDGDNGGDYCEKRNLKVRRENSDYKNATSTSHTHEVNKKRLNSSISVEPSKTHNCMCNKKPRQKRQGNALSINDSKVMSYADLYYLVLNKIIQTNQAQSHDTYRCPCNCITHHTNILFCILCIIFHIIV